jgi:hypothetical protein
MPSQESILFGESKAQSVWSKMDQPEIVLLGVHLHTTLPEAGQAHAQTTCENSSPT